MGKYSTGELHPMEFMKKRLRCKPLVSYSRLPPIQISCSNSLCSSQTYYQSYMHPFKDDDDEDEEVSHLRFEDMQRSELLRYMDNANIAEYDLSEIVCPKCNTKRKNSHGMVEFFEKILEDSECREELSGSETEEEIVTTDSELYEDILEQQPVTTAETKMITA